MDQKVMAGVGNVYRAEVLFRARLDPMRAGRTVDREAFDDMWADLVASCESVCGAGEFT